ncbi:MAG: hypothetical protein HY277_04055 [Ignavibacteriales bacterium]|nr:hypothetical protein [Ignavibacteriales bacterium]
MLVIVILIISGLRDGVFHRVQSLIEKTALLRRFTHVLKKHEHSFNEMDEVVTHAYRNRRGKFYGAVLLEFVSRACMGVEVYLILRGTGVEISLISALFVYVAYSIIINSSAHTTQRESDSLSGGADDRDSALNLMSNQHILQKIFLWKSPCTHRCMPHRRRVCEY